MNDQPGLVKATLTPVGGQSLTVHFNPVSLEHTVSLNTKDEQFTGTGTAKCVMELVFDTTDSGVDVRSDTQRIEQMLVPAKGNGSDPKTAAKMAPPQVVFEWGAFKFQGVLESFKQVLDFWSAGGIPLRATVAVSLSQPKYAFPPLREGGGSPAQVALPSGSPFDAAMAGSTGSGDPTAAARGIAAANGLESLRAEASAGLVVAASGGGIGGAVAFAPAASVSFGAFSALHTASPATSIALSPDKLLAALAAPPLSPDTAFDVSGRALGSAGSAFRADVRGSVQFDS